MDEEVLLDGFELILLPRGAEPFFVRAEEYELVDAAWAADIVVDSLMRNRIDPHWSALRSLGIKENPRDLHPEDLVAMIRRGLRSRPFELHRRRSTLCRKVDRDPIEADAPISTSVSKHYLAIEVVDEQGRPVPNLSFVVRLPDGARQDVSTMATGRARVEGIAPGSCNVRLTAKSVHTLR